VVFTSTQQDADIVADKLSEIGHSVASLHGGMQQGARNRTLRALRNGQLRVLVATDVASRGIDVPSITHVVNYGLPMNAEDYVHRIGRTGRAGRSGLAVTLAQVRDACDVTRIERFINQRIPVSTLPGLEPTQQPQLGRSKGKPAGRGRRGGFGKPAGGSKPFGKPGNFKPRKDAARSSATGKAARAGR
jgi:superfamily II DNA/RNA helicase